MAAPAPSLAEVGVKPLQEKSAALRMRLRRAEAAELRLLEDIVASENLVGAFACEHNLQAVPPDGAGES